MQINDKAVCQLARVQTLMRVTASNMEYAVKWNYITEPEIERELGVYRECLAAIDRFFAEMDCEKTD